MNWTAIGDNALVAIFTGVVAALTDYQQVHNWEDAGIVGAIALGGAVLGRLSVNGARNSIAAYRAARAARAAPAEVAKS